MSEERLCCNGRCNFGKSQVELRAAREERDTLRALAGELLDVVLEYAPIVKLDSLISRAKAVLDQKEPA